MILCGVGVGSIPGETRAAVVECAENVPRLVADDVGEFFIAYGSIQQHEGVAGPDPLGETEETSERIKRVGAPDVNGRCVFG